MHCANGHETINEIGNCYTCGERAIDGDSPSPDGNGSVERGQDLIAAVNEGQISLSLSTLQRLRREVGYFGNAIDDAIAEATKAAEPKKEG